MERYKLLFIRKINFPSSFLAAAAPNSLDFLLTISQFCRQFFTASLEHYSKKGRQGLSSKLLQDFHPTLPTLRLHTPLLCPVGHTPAILSSCAAVYLVSDLPSTFKAFSPSHPANQTCPEFQSSHTSSRKPSLTTLQCVHLQPLPHTAIIISPTRQELLQGTATSYSSPCLLW